MINIEEKILKKYKFIDLFAGIGGFHYALSSYGAKCVFASEWDKYASETYEQNFKIKPQGDITLIDEKNIPQHDILCGGFPCQAFSVSGKQMGFEDTRGTLFFDIARIISHHKPKILFLENVKNLAKHDNGKTFQTIISTLDNLGYNVYSKILNSSNFGLPQNRERVYIVGFEKSINSSSFKFPQNLNTPISLNNILEENPTDAKIITRDDIEIYKDFNIEEDIFGNKVLLEKTVKLTT